MMYIEAQKRASQRHKKKLVHISLDFNKENPEGMDALKKLNEISKRLGSKKSRAKISLDSNT